MSIIGDNIELFFGLDVDENQFSELKKTKMDYQMFDEKIEFHPLCKKIIKFMKNGQNNFLCNFITHHPEINYQMKLLSSATVIFFFFLIKVLEHIRGFFA